MKKIFYLIGIILASATLLLVSCKKDFKPGAEPNNTLITTSFGAGIGVRIQVNREMSFIDLSRGVSGRQWTFPASTFGADSTTALTTSGESVVKARFTKAGVQQVKLHQVFNGNVYVGTQKLTVNQYDTTITVTVLDSVKASFTAQRVSDMTFLTQQNNALNEVTAGKNIQFTSTSRGEPNNFSWKLTRTDGFSISMTGAAPLTKMSSLGTYDLLFVVSSTFGSDTVRYKNYLKVIPSTEPVDLLSVKSENKKIELEFSRDMNNPATINMSAFTLQVKNGVATYPVSVSSAALKAGKDNIIVLTLNAPIYNSDDIKISYSASIGNLTTTDAVAAQSFTNKDVIFNNVNLLAAANYDFGFETSAASDWSYLGWGSPYNKYTFSISGTKVHSGTKSGYLELQANGGSIFSYKPAGNFITFPVVNGKTYEIGCWVYVESLGDKTTTPNLFFYWAPNANFSIPANANFDASYPVNQWVYTKIRTPFPGTGDYRFTIRGYNVGNSQPLKFYMDDISLSEVELR